MMRGRSRFFAGSAGLTAALIVFALTVPPAAAAPALPVNLVASTTAAGAAAEDPAAAADDPACELPLASTFHYTGEPVQCTVPGGITSLTVTVIGGHGGSCQTCGAGGYAGEVVATLPVQPGDPIRIWVGQAGQDHGGWGVAPGGGRGTSALGYDGAGGGGASGVGIGTGDDVTPLVVAGGGGGGGGNGEGANGEPGGAGGAGSRPPTDGKDGGTTPRFAKDLIGIGGAGGHGGGARGPVGFPGDSPLTELFSAGGGGGGGFSHGGDGGGGASAGLIPFPGGGGGGGGGGDSGVALPAESLLYTLSGAHTDGIVTLTTDETVLRDCTQWGSVDLPENVRTVQAIAVGGQGGHANGKGSGKPGFGARLDATIHINPDFPSRLEVAAGCAGTGGGGDGYGNGGWQGTAAGDGFSGGGGGGGSVIQDEGGPIIVAGGGGGPGGASNGSDTTGGIGGNGGDGGHGLGQAGAGSGGDGRGFDAGQGGTGGGNGWINGQNGEDSGLLDAAGAGGGGGGGFILPHSGGGIGGGNGGALAGGGGGGAGASYARDGAATDVRTAVSGQSGNGFIFLRWEKPIPAHVTVVGGDDQQALVGSEYAQPLTVEVTDQNDLPLGGAEIFFVAPGSGPSVGFAGGANIESVMTNGDGIAVSSTLTANQTAGRFEVDVGSISTSARARFSLQNVMGSTTTSQPERSTVVFGQPNSDTATVAGDGPRPSGEVSFSLCGPLASADGCAAGGADAGSAELSGTSLGSATATSPSRAAGSPGTWCYRADYAGDGTYGPSLDASPDGCFTVTKAATTTTLSVTPPAPVSGEPITLTAQVSVTAPGAGQPIGTVTFTDATTVLGAAAVDASGSAALTTAALSVGEHGLVAHYSGDANLLASSSSEHEVPVIRATSTSTLSASPDAAVFGQDVTLDISVAAVAPGRGIPSGSARISTGTIDLGTVELRDGAASLSTSALPVGENAVTLRYGGDDVFTSSTDTTTVIVAPATTSTTVSAGPASTVFGQAVTLNAQVSVVPPGAGAPSGSVEFTNGSTVLGSALVDGSGAATLTTTALPVGAALVNANYSGSPDFRPSSSASAATVAVAQAGTTTDVHIDPVTALSGRAVTIRAHVAPVGPGSGTPTGSVVFSVGSTVLATATVSASGTAVVHTRTLPVGTSTISAAYPGDSNFFGSDGSASVTVDRAPTTTVVSGGIAATGYPVAAPFALAVLLLVLGAAAASLKRWR